MKKGDIVLVSYPFTDLSAKKFRPALVLVLEDDDGDLILAFITSAVTKKSRFDIEILKGKSGLHKDSVLKLKKIMTIHKSLIAGKIGSISQEQLKFVENSLSEMFGIGF